jgi:hypothetical protein
MGAEALRATHVGKKALAGSRCRLTREAGAECVGAEDDWVSRQSLFLAVGPTVSINPSSG